MSFHKRKGLRKSVAGTVYSLCLGLEVRKNLLGQLKVVQCGRIKEGEEGMEGDGLEQWAQAAPPLPGPFELPGEFGDEEGRVWKCFSREGPGHTAEWKISSGF